MTTKHSESELNALSHLSHEEICDALVEIHDKMAFLSTEVALTLQQRICFIECLGRVRKLIGKQHQSFW